MRIVELECYNPNWKSGYEKEIALLFTFLFKEIVSAHHIGSTAIPNIKAKPIIDILLEVKTIHNLDTHDKNFKNIGYEVKGEFGITGRRFYQKGGHKRTHHIHAYEQGNPEINRHIRFRDYLISNRNKALEYEALKIRLCQQFGHDPESYSMGKSIFIRAIDDLLIK